MTAPPFARPTSVSFAVAAALALVAAGCGSSSPTGSSVTTGSAAATGGSSSAAAAPTTTTSSPATAAKPARSLRLHILAPRAGAHTGQDLTVRVALTGSASGRLHTFRYVLDGVLTRRGPAQLTFHGLAPGHQHLVVSVAGGGGAHASATFVVHAPPAPPVAPTATMSTPAPAPTAPTQTMSTPAPAPTAPATTMSATTSAPAPAPAGGIPQGNGGDMDGDNNGGPSDGDGGV